MKGLIQSLGVISILLVTSTALFAQSITDINPNIATQGDSLEVTITGQNTHFAQNSTTVSFSREGINVSSIVVVSGTLLNATFNIAINAATGLWDISVHDDYDGTLTLSNGFLIISNPAVCPSADLTGDCWVDFEDFAVMASQWLTGYANIPDDMVHIPSGGFEMGNHFSPEGYFDELPLHLVLLNAFFMGKYEIINQQYCDYLNSAYDSNEIKVDGGVVYDFNDTGNSYPYCDTHSASSYSQIDYNDVSGTFSVRTKGSPPRDMSNDPMVMVSWYGAVAYCNWRSNEEGYEECYDLSTWDCNFTKHGYRLATEAEWEYAARGGLSGRRFPWNDPNISHSRANYYAAPGSLSYDENPTSGYHPDWNDGHPYTSPAGTFSANGYGLYDMAGNVIEWCNDWYDENYYDISPYDNPTGPFSGPSREIRGGSWEHNAYVCRVAFRYDLSPNPGGRDYALGFRVVLDLE